jgi:glycerophosphoryl diester phosphodiesterase
MPSARCCGLILLLGAGVSLADDPNSTRPSGTPMIVAHRGLLQHAPENTVAAFASCLDLKLGFEVDVRRAKDGALVCVHDETVERTTNGQGRVEELTLGQLKALDAGAWFDPAFRGQRVPTVDEVFALLAGSKEPEVLVAVDMKGSDEQIEQDVVTLAARHQILKRLLFIGRTIDVPAVRQRLKAANAAARVARLAETPEQFRQALQDPQCDWAYARFLPSAEEVRQAHTAGKRVFIAGPRVAGQETANWTAAHSARVDAILTDYPLELRQTLRRDIVGEAAK